MSIAHAIVDLAHAIANEGGRLVTVELDEMAYARLAVELEKRMYVMSPSPRFVSSPPDLTAIVLNTDAGAIHVKPAGAEE